MTSSITSCNAVVIKLSQNIEIVKSFLGLKIIKNQQIDKISISHSGYINLLLAKFNMTNAK